MAFIETKGMLARLLATENLVVEHSATAKSACFNVSTRVMTLPIWKTESEYVYNLFVSHEVGHALWTPSDFPTQLEDNQVNPAVANIVEDVRIEKKIQSKFPGLRKDYSKGYNELNDADLFEVKGQDISKLGFLDRVNLHFKIGAHLLVPFSEAESVIVTRINECETWEDVMRVSKLIQEYVQKMKEQLPADGDMQFSEEQQTGEGGGEGGTPSGSGEGQDSGEDGEDGEDSDSKQGEESGKSQSPDSSGSSSESQSQGSSAPQGSPGGTNSPSQPSAGELESKTQDALNDAMSKMVESMYANHLVYLKPPTPKASSFVHSIEKVRSSMVSSIVEEMLLCGAQKEYQKFILESRRDVNHMVQQFEMKKSADAYSRIQVNKTGVLNTSELHNYRLADDIFLRQETTPDGKSHGMVMLLDWSQSMDTIAEDTIRQILVLVQFCRKVQIPFRVFTFTTGYSAAYGRTHPNNEPACDAQIVEVLNSFTKKNQLDKDMLNLYLIGAVRNLSRRYSRSFGNPCTILGMGGTPLNNALFMSYDILKQFKEESKVDKLSFVVITDGESAPLRYTDDRGNMQGLYSGTVMIRSNNGAVFPVKAESHNVVPGGIAKWLSVSLPYVSVTNIFLGSASTCTRYASNVCNSPYGTPPKFKSSEFTKNNGAHFTTQDNWPLVALMNPSSFSNASELEVASTATTTQVKTAFKKFLNKKSGSKKVLTEIISSFA